MTGTWVLDSEALSLYLRADRKMTARRAVAVLRDEGLVRTIAQRGTYVVPPGDRGAAG